MKGKFGKRVIAAGLAAVLAVSMCACGKDGSSKGGKNENSALAKENVYRETPVTMPEFLDDPENGYVNVQDLAYRDGKVYMIVQTRDYMTDETAIYVLSMKTDGSELEQTALETAKNNQEIDTGAVALPVEGVEGETGDFEEEDGESNIWEYHEYGQFVFDSNGSIYGVHTYNREDSSNPEVTGGIDAFAIGVAAVNPEAKIYVAVTNSWDDPDKEKAASEQLLDMGCDVMAQHCDTPYPQTLAQERGVYGIGYNSDMSKETPDACLTSVIWNWSAYYTSAVKSIINGTWDGSNYYGGMAEGLVQLTNLASFAAEGTQEKVDEATAEILSGSNNVFDGVMETNTGETVGTENGTLDDATITGGIDWYYKNVVIVD